MDIRRPLRILLVEDHPDTLRLTGRLLTMEGHEVHAAHSAAEALRLAEAQRPDLLVSDIGLRGDGGSGLDLMRELRQRYGLAGIAVSGRSESEDMDESRSAGFLEHLVKPYQPTDLVDAVRRAASAVSSNGVGAASDDGHNAPTA